MPCRGTSKKYSNIKKRTRKINKKARNLGKSRKKNKYIPSTLSKVSYIPINLKGLKKENLKNDKEIQKILYKNKSTQTYPINFLIPKFIKIKGIGTLILNHLK